MKNNLYNRQRYNEVGHWPIRWMKKLPYYLPDGIHPNANGMTLLFKRVAECFDEML